MNQFCRDCEHYTKARMFSKDKAPKCAAAQIYDPIYGSPTIPIAQLPTCESRRTTGTDCPDFQVHIYLQF